mmetsp:Transcript_131990/g.410295  ORF Transcript_131990/g.410295 Transcript_131990/m.410295 type:complete len:259 (+) Transcript_131990:309-1085(+)
MSARAVASQPSPHPASRAAVLREALRLPRSSCRISRCMGIEDWSSSDPERMICSMKTKRFTRLAKAATAAMSSPANHCFRGPVVIAASTSNQSLVGIMGKFMDAHACLSNQAMNDWYEYGLGGEGKLSGVERAVREAGALLAAEANERRPWAGERSESARKLVGLPPAMARGSWARRACCCDARAPVVERTAKMPTALTNMTGQELGWPRSPMLRPERRPSTIDRDAGARVPRPAGQRHGRQAERPLSGGRAMAWRRW